MHVDFNLLLASIDLYPCWGMERERDVVGGGGERERERERESVTRMSKDLLHAGAWFNHN